MKKVAALVLALCMLISLVPATFAAEDVPANTAAEVAPANEVTYVQPAAAEEDIVFDFGAWLTANSSVARHTEMTAEHMANIAPNKSTTAQTGGFFWETATNPKTMRLCNLRPDWATVPREGGNGSNNKIAFDITVSADDAGWYSLELPFSANAGTDKLSIYMVADGIATYLGDVTSASGKTNAVNLKAGTNTLVLCCVDASGQATTTVYLQKLIFTPLAAEPTATINATVPTTLGVGGKAENLTASISMSDGTTYQFPTYAIDAATLQSNGADTDNYLKVEAEDESVLSVIYEKTDATTTTYSIEALKGGETNVVFTPVIDGVEQTSKAVKKPFSVVQDEVTALSLSSAVSSIAVGKTTTLTAKTSWSISPERVEDASAVTFESLNDFATVDANGVVTGVSEGTAEIKATLKADTSKTDTVEIEITAVAPPRTHEYVTSQAGFNVDKMLTMDDYSGKPVIRAANSAMYFAQMFDWTYEVPAEYSATGEAFMALDTTKTDKWALVKNYGPLGTIHVVSSCMQQQFVPSYYTVEGRTNFVALRLNVEVAGEYILQAKSGYYTNGAATAVYFFKEGTAGTDATVPSTYPASSKLGYYDMAASKSYSYMGDVSVEEEGNYILAFVADENSMTINGETAVEPGSGQDIQWFNLAGVKLVPAGDNVLEDFKVTAAKGEIQKDTTTTVSASATWSVMGESEVAASDVIFESSDTSIATVDANGIVTGVSKGTVTITATYKNDTSKSDTVNIVVITPGDTRIFEYVTSQAGFNVDKMLTMDDYSGKPVLRAANNALYFTTMLDWAYEVPSEYSKDGVPFMSLDTTADDGDGKLSDRWALVANRGGSHLGAIHLAPDCLQQQFQLSNFIEGGARTNFAAIRLNVDAPGEYLLQAKAGHYPSGVVTRAYFFKEGADGVVIGNPLTYPEDAKLSYFNSAKAIDYTFIANVTVDEMGDYILAFVAEENAATLNKVTLNTNGQDYQWFNLSGVRLVPADYDFLTGLSIEAETDIIYNGETLDLDVKETWEYAGKKAIEYSELTFESSSDAIAMVDANGVVTAISEGKVTITATMNNDPYFSEEFEISVYDPNAENIGVNLIYNIGTGSMKDKTTYNPHNNRLETSTGRLRDPSYVDSYDEIDETVTELWAYNNYANITWRAFEMDSALLSPSPSDYPKGSFYALKLRVPVKGTYDLNIETYPFTIGCEADVYLLPKGDIENITLADVEDIDPIGTVTSRDFENRVQTAGTVTIERGGDYFILLKLHSDNKYLSNTGRHYFSLQKVIFEAARGPFNQIDVAIETVDNEGDELYFNAYRKISYTLLDEYGNEIDILNPELVEVNSISLTKGEDVARIAFDNGNYYVETWDAAGDAEVTVDITYRGTNAVKTFAFKVADIGKSGRTLYTDEMVSAARENISKYAWARDEKKAAVEKADKYLANGLDFLWYSVTGNGVPRTYHVGYEGDGYEYYCRYCRKDLYALGYSNYPFNVNPLKTPWKITCPECARNFPSNDFESFYELGITQENGAQFDRITALENHRAMLIERGLLSDEAIALVSPGEDCSDTWYLYYGYGVKGGYLHNDLYSEVADEDCPVLFDPNIETVERWGVDDSMGYNTGKMFENGVEEVHTYIGFYNHFAHFYIKNETLYLNALSSLRDAYLFTGDEKYGIAGAILTDRLADIYPTYDLNIYLPRFTNINGGSFAGKAVGKIWETYVAEYLADAYDAFYPAFENPEVIEYLNNKAVYYGMENDKSTAVKIRQNIEDGICREIYETALTSQLNGNFGLNQLAVGKAAIALDHKNDTAEMLEWLYKSKWTNDMSYNTGGEISERLVDVVYRDGQNYESPSYNNLGVTDFIKVAESLARYKENGGEFNEIPILEHPKYLKLINSFQTLTLVRRGVKAIADSGQPAYYNKFPDRIPLATAFYYTKDSENPEVREEAIKMAQHLYMQQGKDLKDHHFDIYTRDPEALYDEVMAIIEEYGEYPYDKSSIMTGYGFAALRDGALFDTVGITGVRDTTRDFTLNFSGHSHHQHNDSLDLGMEAYGIGMTMDLGYPETALAGDPHTAQWSNTVLAHNTVMVDEAQMSRPDRTSEPSLHFDAKDTRVKVIDARTPQAYPTSTEEYRRTIVMVDYDDEVSYGIDFFRVVGGSDHLYTFSPNSNNRPEKSANLTFIKQVDEPQSDWIYDENHYPFSSYAGPTVQFGWDPYTDMSKVEAPKKFPLGYTWMFNVERADNTGENEFWLDYAIDDFGKDPSRNPNLDVRLRITMLNDFDADEVSLVSTKPQRVEANECVGDLEKFLVRRKGERLDSLFTAVYEPYKAGDRYVTDIQSETLAVEKIAGVGTDKDVAKAVKVVLNDDRVDYIVYASNKDNTYRITDGEYSFEFSGFVGVWTVNGDGENIYSYIHDGEALGEGENKVENAEDVITGTVIDFQKDLSLDNWIDVTFDRDFTQEEADDLVDRMMNIERETPGNSSYVIEGITMTDARNARINLNSTSLISNYKDVMDFSKGYDYNIEEMQTFEIPMSYEMSGNPVFDEVGKQSVSAGSSISIKLNATPVSEDYTITYRARTLPRGAGFDAATATFTWKPTATQVGNNLVAIDAIDSAGRIATLYFEIEVFGSTSGGGGGGFDIPSTDPDEPIDEPDEPIDEPDEPIDEPDEPIEGGDVAGEDKGFIDLGNHAWAEDSINALADEGIIKGTSATTFAPANNITRADYAILLVRAFKLESDNEENFADVNASDYFARELAIARNTGIVAGIGDNKYAPRNTITRQDMMVILYRALTKMGVELTPIEGIDVESYADYADVADYAKEAVKALVEAGLVNGKGDKLAGSDFTTRAEVAVLLKRVLDYIAVK